MMLRIMVLVIAVALTGCTIKTPPYAASIENNQIIKRSGISPVTVGEISVEKKLNKISLRGSPLKSSVGASYGDYLEDALLQELKLAKLWSSVSTTVVSGEIIENDIDVSGFSKGIGLISVKFTVKNNENIVFEKVVTANTEIDSSFIGAIAIPNGQANYPVLIQQLIKTLFSDQEFIKALS